MSKKPVNGFVMLPRDLLRGNGWHALSYGARCLALEMASHFHGGNNGAIAYSQRQCMRAFRVSSKTAVKWFRELEEHHIIKPTRRGSFDQKTGEARGTTWHISFLKNVNREESK
jgi:hypothetical protein